MTFTEWLKSQGGRKDAIGDPARAAAADLHTPNGDARYAHWREHLEDKRAGRASLSALEEARREYSVLHRPPAAFRWCVPSGSGIGTSWRSSPAPRYNQVYWPAVQPFTGVTNS
jgi:hypothetical protein